MPIDKTASHERIVTAAKKEFLEYGFADASMRRIADEAGMSVAGLYKHFKSKEDMFSALVEPTYREFLSLFRQAEKNAAEESKAGDLSALNEAGEATMALTFIYDHPEEFHLLVTALVNAAFEAVRHDFSREEALHYASTLDRFFSKAWKEFFGY